MNRQIVFIFCVWLAAQRAVADHVVSSWTGGTGNWSTAANWSPSTFFPNNGNGGNTYDAGIGGGTVTLDQDIAVQDFYLSGNVVFGPLGTLTATSPYTLTVNGAMTWDYTSTMSGSGQTVIAPTGSLSLIGGFDHTHLLNRQLVNNGTATSTGLTLLQMNGGTFINNGSFITDVGVSGQAEAIVKGTGGTNAFNNYGTFTKLGDGTTVIGNSSGDLAFNNYGAVDIQAGVLRLETVSTVPSHTGNFTIAGGAALRLGGTHNFAASSNLSGSGTLYLRNATANIDGPQTFGGRIYFESNGTANINSNSTIGSVSLISTSSVGLGGTGTVTLTGASDWSGGVMSGSGQTVIAAGGSLAILGGFPNLNRHLVNNGEILWYGGGLGLTNATLTNNGTFTADPGAGAGLSSNSGGGTNVFNNVGTYAKQGAGFTNHGVTFNNSGTVNVQAGTLGLLGGGTHTGDFNIASGSLLDLSGSHSFAASVDVTGAGTMRISNGTYSFSSQQFAASTLSIGSNGIANFSGPTTLNRLQMTDNALLGSGTVTVAGDCTWNGGIMSASGQTVIANTASLAIGATNNANRLSRQLVNNGTTTWAGGTFQMNDGIFINNGSFTANVSSGTLNSVGIGGTNVFNNPGSFTKQGDGTTRFVTFFNGVTFNNTGIVDVQAGTLELESVTQHVGNQLTAGIWRVHSAATLDISTGSNITTNHADVTLDGSSSTFAKINSLVDNQGSFSILNGRNFTAAGAFSNTGTLTAGSGSTFTAPSLTQLSGGELTGGTLRVGGTLSVPGSNITTNHGNVTLDGPTATFSQIESLVDNRGSFAILNGRNFTPIGMFHNRGTLTIGSNSTFTASSGLTQYANGTLRGTGTLIGNFDNPGRLAPGNSPGLIDITGDYTQTSTGVLEIEVGGRTPGLLHDQVRVTGKAVLDGRLEMSLVAVPGEPLYTPQVGDEITFLTAQDGVDEEFSSAFFPNLPAAVAHEIDYNSNDVLLRFVAPQPIQFVSSEADPAFGSNLTWKINNDPAVPVSKSVINFENLAGVPQRVHLTASNESAHQLVIGDSAKEIALRVHGVNLSVAAGTVIEDNGAIELENLAMLVSQSVDVEAGGLLAGNGTIKTNKLNVSGGTLRPGFSVGHLDVEGAYQQGANGVLAIDIEGSAPNQFDTVDIDGVATLGGTLQINAAGLGTPASGTRYPILTADGLVGTFARIESSGNGNAWFLARYIESIGGGWTAYAEIKYAGDMDGDDAPGTDDDVKLFALALTSPGRYYDECECNDYGQAGGDINRDGRLDFQDIPLFAQAAGVGTGAIMAAIEASVRVPEPSSGALMLCATSFLAIGRRRR